MRSVLLLFPLPRRRAWSPENSGGGTEFPQTGILPPKEMTTPGFASRSV